MQQYYATIDLGSNSFHLLTAVLEHDEIKILESLSEQVMLAEGLSKSDGITQEAMQRGIDCLSRFSQKITQIPKTNMRIVGTNTLRAAVNAREFVKILEQMLEVEIEIVSGIEEARLIFLGVNHSWSSLDARDKHLVIDIGGGSTEFIVGSPFKLKTSASLRMGCVSFRHFFPNDEISLHHFNQAMAAARYEMINLQDSIPNKNWKFAIGSAGTFKALENILKENQLTSEGINPSGLKALKKLLLQYTHMDQIELAGLKPSRQKSILPGLAIALAIFEAMEIKDMQISRGGLREGILYDLLGRVHNEDVRARSVTAIRKRYQSNSHHPRIMSKTAEKLLKKLHCEQDMQLELSSQQLVHWASQTCQIGLAINHSQYHIHSAYLLEHSELNGFSLKDHKLLAVIVANHRRKLNLQLVENLPYSESQKRQVMAVIVIVRLAHILVQAGQIESLKNISLQITSSEIKLSGTMKWLKKRPLIHHALLLEKQYWEITKISFILNFATKSNIAVAQ